MMDDITHPKYAISVLLSSVVFHRRLCSSSQHLVDGRYYHQHFFWRDISVTIDIVQVENPGHFLILKKTESFLILKESS